jgi:glycosyltransferase involved in cell wall biosynthesis
MKLGIYIVTYKRKKTLNQTIQRLLDSDVTKHDFEITVINNHSDFSLNGEFESYVNVLHNETRPNLSNGNLGENWNQALMHGFRDLKNPRLPIVVTFQNDTSVSSNWCENLEHLHNEKGYTFVTGKYGDNFVSYQAEAVRKIGMWDENFCGIQYKEADYYIRALKYNRDRSSINDELAKLFHNREKLDLDVQDGHSFKHNRQRNTPQRLADDAEHRDLWKQSRGGPLALHLMKYFKYKWADTWKKQPEMKGWITDWSAEFVKNPPSDPKPVHMQYFWFEKDITNRKIYF